MVYKLGDEFRSVATPSPELLRKLLYHATIDSGSVLTAGFKNPRAIGSERESDEEAAIDMAWLQLSESVQARIESLQQRVDGLDRASLLAVQETQERLDMTRRDANRAKDGRRVYETEDGRTVFDEQGTEIARDGIDPNNWNSGGPTWEHYNRTVNEVEEMKEFRTKVLEQKARLENGPSAEELDDIEASLDELERDMPPDVRIRHDRLGAQDSEPRTMSAAASYTDRTGFETAPHIESAFSQAADNTQTPAVAPEPVPESPAVQPGRDFSI